MFGVQWDLVLKHIEVKEGTNDTKLAEIKTALRSDSSSWENYGNSTILTGSNETYKKMNIYDLAGNVWKWTLEYTTLPDTPDVCRAGCYGGSGSSRPASSRYGSSISLSSGYIGFRTSLYK